MVIKCEVNGLEAWYYAGQKISGQICLSLNDRILVKAISVKIAGFGQTEWNSTKKETEKPNIVKGREDFIATTTFLVGSEDSTSILIPSGDYNYNFSCDIPEKSPSSFNSINGHIRYQVCVILDYGSKTEEILRETFHVTKPFDLRTKSDSLKLPVDMEVFESKFCWEYWKTPLCLYVNIPRGAFVPGETVSVYARLINDGNISLKSISISFNQVVTYISKSPRELRLIERYNMVQNLSSLAGNESLREFLERIPIPSVPPSCETDCEILQISYEIEVLVDQVKGKRGVAVRIPILIGTIAMEGDIDNEKDLEEKESSSTTPAAMLSSSSVKSLNKETDVDVPPEVIMNTPSAAASFQEASFMSSTNLNEKEKNVLNKDGSHFKPKYLYYEINEDIEMTPTTMEITKEITIASA